MPEAEIRSIPIWRGEVAIEPLPGGITNRNYRVVDGDRAYAVRTGQDDQALGICRRNEFACTENAARLGIAPRVAYAVPGMLVSDFIPGTTLTPELLVAPERLKRVAGVIRDIHAASEQVIGHLLYFCPFQAVRTYICHAQRDDLELPVRDADELTREVRDLHARIGPFTPTFCHNDMMPGNLLETKERLWVIDWEYSGIGHPIFDLAGLSSNCEFDAKTDRLLLQAYGAADEPFLTLKAIAALRESLWAVIQMNKSSIDFDYVKYRDDNYQKYLHYKEALD